MQAGCSRPVFACNLPAGRSAVLPRRACTTAPTAIEQPVQILGRTTESMKFLISVVRF